MKAFNKIPLGMHRFAMRLRHSLNLFGRSVSAVPVWGISGVAVWLLSSAVAVGAGIRGSKHNLSTAAGGALGASGSQEMCVFCHTPHTAGKEAALWNRFASQATYIPYRSSTTKATIGQPTGASKMCLSCHDGTVANDSFANGGVLQTGTHYMTSTNLVGASGTLTSDHPIAFTYNGALATADGHLNTPVSSSYVDAAHQLPLYNNPSPGVASSLECATCHSVHDNTYGKFLRMNNAGSAMCRTCHTQ